MQSKSILSFLNENDILEQAITHRRHIHSHPELAFEEFATADYIIKVLEDAGFDEVYPGIGETGVVAVLRGQLNQSILIRADMDALPLQEVADVPYAS
jgi:hippurate hydrolase